MQVSTPSSVSTITGTTMMTLTTALRRLPLLLAPALLALAVGNAQAQQAPATLSLEEAITLAKRYNPDYRAQANDPGVADWQVREAYANFVPTASVSGGASYTLPGTERLGSTSFAEQTPPQYSSSYRINLGMFLSGATFFDLARARANRNATDARVIAAGYSLASDVTRDYLAAMRARDATVVARQSLETARETKKLADARFAGGAATQLDVAQADVAVGRAEVALVQAENQAQGDQLRLMQRLGVSLDRDVELTSKFEVFDPTWTRESLLAMSTANHPILQAARASESASLASARAAKMAYLPTVSIGGGWNGFTREIGDRDMILSDLRSSIEGRRESCEINNKFAALINEPLSDCTRHVYTQELEAAAIAQNNQFPFKFTTGPPSFGVSISLPIFDGFTREVQLQQSRAQADDAKHQRRAAELAQTTAVSTAHANVTAARRLVDIEQRNTQAAELALNIARERYRLGADQFDRVATAQQIKAQADQSYLAALYAFHENVAALESAVGQPLRGR
jgi:outer membrane protein TolC